MAGNFLLDVNKNVIAQSIWWRDILRIGGEESGGWFKSNMCNVLGSGNLIHFWQERWLGHESFMNLFPQLYAKSLQPDAPIAAFGSWSDDNWTWSFDWVVELARDDMDAATEMSILLADIRPKKECLDHRKWLMNHAGMFTVKSAYCFLQNRDSFLTINSNVVDALQDLWMNDVPSKVNIFGWRLLLARLPTRMALVRKGIINNPREFCCVFCFREEEDIDHLFFNCSVSIQVWKKIYKWMAVDFIPFEEGWKHFISFGDLVMSKRLAKTRHVIWLATTWSIWRTRNNIVFRGYVFNLDALIDQIIFISWFWFIGRLGVNTSFVFSDWCNDPLVCIDSI
ncbi:uncharacterized protein LOC123923074 [Trifolium pratense]|uniref:uncharacterized protein LOC123923074 n=1 Tax=Trifolium pratense TaxID=57577 RepID=UPI001E691F6F|nr:uncharacterized protein LOC123923074 [Trifolium pratense]